jgi:hypothetical protein
MNPTEIPPNDKPTPSQKSPVDTNSIYPQVSPNPPEPTISNLPPTTTPYASNVQSKTQLKKIIWTVIVIGLVIGLATYIYDNFLYQRLHTLKGGVVGHSYIAHKVNVGGETFNISFDKSSESRNPDSNQLIMLGNDLKGNKTIVTLTHLTAPTPVPPKVSPDLCEGIGATGEIPVSQRNNIKIGTVNILGSTDTLCGFPATSPTGPFSSAYVEFSSKGNWFNLDLSSINSSNQPSNNLDIGSAKTIAESITTN